VSFSGFLERFTLASEQQPFDWFQNTDETAMKNEENDTHLVGWV
jgi:hypothetical protein